MLLGSPYEVNLKAFPYSDYRPRTDIKVKKEHMAAEAKRRIKDEKAPPKLPNYHAPNEAWKEYLQKNGVKGKSCLRFLKAKEKALKLEISIIVNSNQAKNSATGTNKTPQWRNNKSFLRLYHAVADNAEEFLTRDDVLDRSQLDSPEKTTFYHKIADVFNDSAYKPWSKPYPDL